MISQPITQLLQIKELREESAAREVKIAQRTLNEVIAQLEEAKQKLKDYIKWREQREKELYDEVMGTTVVVKALNDIKQKIASLRNRDLQLKDDIQLAEKKKREAEAALQAAKQAHIDAQKAVEKYSELSEQVLSAEQAEAEMKEDLEMEEFGRAVPMLV